MNTNFINLPQELQTSGHFCVWKLEQGTNGRMTKIPYNPQTGRLAKSNDVNTFTDFDTAVETAESGQYSGVGLGIFDDVCAIDIDNCMEDNGVLSDMAQDIITIMNAYAEYSPSGKGVRILFTAQHFNYDKAVYYINNQKAGLEVYVVGATKKCVTVTGNVISTGEYGDRTAELQIVLDKYMKRKPEKKAPAPVSDQPTYNLLDTEILKKASTAKNSAKFNLLYGGDINAYKSHSEADLALCNLLAFWCGRDPEQMDRLFRGSGLFRDKWDSARAGTT